MDVDEPETETLAFDQLDAVSQMKAETEELCINSI